MNSFRYVMTGMMVSAGFLAVGCHSGAKDAAPAQAGQPQSGPAWTLTLKSACASAAQDQCVAKYGFTVDADGKYQIGPGPQGQLRKGAIPDTEFGAFKTQVQKALASSSTWGTENHASGVENESDDSLVLSHAGASDRVIAHNTAGEFYYSTTSVEEAKALHAAIHDLANGYYRLPFGDACGDAADKITAASLELQTCQSNADCVYIDAYQGFEVVPPASVQWLLTEDCTAVKPMVVANKLAIEGGSHKIEELYAAARNTCGAEFTQSTFGRECNYEQKATQVQPVCVQNHCQSRL